LIFDGQEDNGSDLLTTTDAYRNRRFFVGMFMASWISGGRKEEGGVTGQALPARFTTGQPRKAEWLFSTENVAWIGLVFCYACK